MLVLTDMTIDKIEEHLKKYDLDIRKKENARGFDQKGKTDVITFLAECVLKLIIKNHDKKFSNRDIWESEHFKKKVPFLFNKPKPSNPKAKNEYDKFVSQPKFLSFIILGC